MTPIFIDLDSWSKVGLISLLEVMSLIPAWFLKYYIFNFFFGELFNIFEIEWEHDRNVNMPQINTIYFAL
jgi:hypothetical protein